MAHYYPVIINSGTSKAGDSLGFHAYSLRIDNLTNQWYLEETSMAWIPPYSLGMCLRLYGTGVAIILNQAPVGQPQLAPIAGEQVVGVYSDQLRTEVGAQAVRQFTAVVAVSDLTWSAQPALPPPGVSRLYADSNGQLHYLLPSGTDRTIIDSGNWTTYVTPAYIQGIITPAYIAANAGTTPLGGDLAGTVNNGTVRLRYGGFIQLNDNTGIARNFVTVTSTETWIQNAMGGLIRFINQAGNTELGYFDNSGNFHANGSLWTSGILTVEGTANIGGDVTAQQQLYIGTNATYPAIYLPNNSNYVVQSAGLLYLRFNGGINVTNGAGNTYTQITSGAHYVVGGSLSLDSNQRQWMGGNGTGPSLRSDGVNQIMNIGASGQLLVKNLAESNWMPITALAFNVGSSISIKTNLQPIENPVATVLNPALHGWTYELVDSESPASRIGFVADHWYPVYPQLVSIGEDGEPEAIDYAAIGAITFEALKVYVTETNNRLQIAESRLSRLEEYIGLQPAA